MGAFSDIEGNSIENDDPSGDDSVNLIDVLKAYFVKGFFVSFALFAFCRILSEISKKEIAELGKSENIGKIFVFETGLLAEVANIFLLIVVVEFMALFYSIPVLFVRKKIGYMLRVALFLVFGVSFFVIQIAKPVAVLETEHAFVFVYPWPIKRDDVKKNSYRNVSYSDKKISAAISLYTFSHGPLLCPPAWSFDTDARKVNFCLYQRLKQYENKQ